VNRLTVLAISAVFFLAAQSVSAEVKMGGWYWEGLIGMALIPDQDIYTRVTPPTVSGDVSWDIGVNGGGVLGYKFGDYVRTELNVQIQFNRLDTVNLAGYRMQGAGNVLGVSPMANVLFDLPLSMWIDNPADSRGVTPYIGGGVGLLHTKLKSDSDALLVVSDSDSSFAWNAMAGVAIEVAHGIDATLNYRYLSTTGNQKYDVGIRGTLIQDQIAAQGATHTFTVGFRYYFTLGTSLK
jgi:opacity protein-like surface antigen